MKWVQLKIFWTNFENIRDKFESEILDIKKLTQKDLIKYVDERTYPINLQLFVEDKNQFCEQYIRSLIWKKTIDDFKILETNQGFFLIILAKDYIFCTNLSNKEDIWEAMKIDHIHNWLYNSCVQSISMFRKINEYEYLFAIRSGRALFWHPRYEKFAIINPTIKQIETINNQTDKWNFLIRSYNHKFEEDWFTFEWKFCKDLYEYDHKFDRWYDGHRWEYDEGEYHMAKWSLDFKRLDLKEISLK